MTKPPLTTLEQDQQFVDTLRLEYYAGVRGLAATLMHLHTRHRLGNYVGKLDDSACWRLWLLVMRPYLGNCKPPENIRRGYKNNGGCECQDQEERRRTHSAYSTTRKSPSPS